jgi:hypothetical protein
MTEKEIFEMFSSIFSKAIEEGLKQPFYSISLSTNDNIMLLKSEKETHKMLYNNITNKMQSPIYIFVFDTKGRSFKAKIETESGKVIYH